MNKMLQKLNEGQEHLYTLWN